MDKYTLNELAALTGILPDTIRIWERRYGFLTPHRTSTNRRFYDSGDLKKLINISILNNNGYKVSKIALLNDNEIAERARELTEVTPGVESDISVLLIAMTEFDEETINTILMRSIMNRGFETTFRVVVFPFLRRIGVMWHTGSAGVGEEHFISFILRRKLISAIDNLIVTAPANARRILLFLPENEYHEISMLYYHYLVLKAGNRVRCLGQSTPLEAVSKIASVWKPDVIITGSVTGLGMKHPAEYLESLSASFPGIKILVAGTIAGFAGNKAYPNIFPVSSEDELKKLLK